MVVVWSSRRSATYPSVCTTAVSCWYSSSVRRGRTCASRVVRVCLVTSIRGIAGAILAVAEPLAKARRQRIAEDLFDRVRRPLAGRVVTAPGRATQDDPIGGAITRAPEALGIDEGFEEVNGVPVDLLPVLRQEDRHPTEHVGGQMRHRDPRQDQKPCVVGNAADVAAPLLGRPADEAIARGEVPRRR